MSRTIIVADPARSVLWSTALQPDGSDIETIDPTRAMADLFLRDPADVAILQIDQPHSVTMMLIPQIKHLWPGCQILAIATDHVFSGPPRDGAGGRPVPISGAGSRHSGSGSRDDADNALWMPHRLLIHPVNACELRATVALIRARVAAARISVGIDPAGPARKALGAGPRDGSGLDVIPDNLS